MAEDRKESWANLKPSEVPDEQIARLLDVQRLDAEKKRLFMVTFARRGTRLRACVAAKITYKQHAQWLAEDPVYADTFAHAQEAHADLVEDRVIQLAYEGIATPVVRKGQVVGTRMWYSERMLEMLIRAKKPGQYVERQEQAGSHTVIIRHDKMDDEDE